MPGLYNKIKSFVAVAVTASVFGAGVAAAQQMGRPRIWDVQLGAHVSELPAAEFVDLACGSNGGPPGAAIGGFAQFAICPQELETGFHEIWFRYDDEMEYVARAFRDPALVLRNMANTVLAHPVVFSLLIDDAGIIQGYRVITDQRAAADVRRNAATVAVHFKGRFGNDSWACTDLPPSDGETPIGRQFLKERCEMVDEGRRLVVESHYFHKRGQAALDPRTQLPMVGEFESLSRLEVIQIGADRR
jgi:hypothetical protein